MVRCLPGCDTSGVSILAVSGSQGARLRWFPVRPGRAARRYIARPEGRPGRESRTPYFVHKCIMRPQNSQGLMCGQKSQTDRMTSVILLSDVDVLDLYPNPEVYYACRRKKRFCFDPLSYIAMGPYQTAIRPHWYIGFKRYCVNALKLTGIRI